MLGPSVLLSNAEGQNPYSGVARVESRATCTGVFIVPTQGVTVPASAPAYILTNGHCPAFPGSNQVLLDQPSPGKARVVFNYFADTPNRQLAVGIRRVLYATMKGRDVALLELDVRHRDLEARGIMAWRVTARGPLPREPVVIVGAPLRANPGEAFLRLASCPLEGRAPTVFEFSWFWFDSDRLRCADVGPGSSGSPVISRATGRVVGLVNTTSIGTTPYTACSLDHPCEPEPSQADPSGNVYATNIDGLDRCFSQLGFFDLTLPGCPLDPGRQPTTTPARLGYVNPLLTSVPVGRPRAQWNVTVSGDLPYYRYKIVAAATGDCRDPRGYGRVRSVAVDPIVDEALPTRDAWCLLCVVGGATTEWGPAWQSFAHATVVTVRIDTMPPRLPAQVTIEEGPESWRLTVSAVDPEVSAHLLKFGTPDSTRCEDPARYSPALVPFYSVPKRDGPQRLCVIPYDAAGNRGDVLETILR